jgi:hypothetical protein
MDEPHVTRVKARIALDKAKDAKMNQKHRPWTLAPPGTPCPWPLQVAEPATGDRVLWVGCDACFQWHQLPAGSAEPTAQKWYCADAPAAWGVDASTCVACPPSPYPAAKRRRIPPPRAAKRDDVKYV